jgi:hypothetical protein
MDSYGCQHSDARDCRECRRLRFTPLDSVGENACGSWGREQMFREFSPGGTIQRSPALQPGGSGENTTSPEGRPVLTCSGAHHDSSLA